MKKNAAIFIAVLIGIFFAGGARAGILPDCGGPKQDPCTICNLFELINNIIAGFKMLTNQNNAEVWAESKKIILMVIIGLVLIYGSFAIVTAVFQGMGYVGDNPLQFNNVNCPAAP